jgi:uncharacterized membrane protein
VFCEGEGIVTSGIWKLLGLLAVVAVVSFVLGFFVVSRFVG